ncbi:hypothetical protein DAT1711_12710 [Enterococcus cecorum]
MILINLPPIVQLTELSYHIIAQKDNAHEVVSKILKKIKKLCLTDLYINKSNKTKEREYVVKFR